MSCKNFFLNCQYKNIMTSTIRSSKSIKYKIKEKKQQEINRSKAHKPSPNHPYVVAGRRKFKDNKI